MGQYRENDLTPGGESFGEASATSTQDFAIPTLVNGDKPERVRVAVAGDADFWVSISNGVQAVDAIIGMHVNSAGAVILRAGGQTHINHIASATGSSINVTPLNP